MDGNDEVVAFRLWSREVRYPRRWSLVFGTAKRRPDNCLHGSNLCGVIGSFSQKYITEL